MTRGTPGPDGRQSGAARAERAQAELTGTMLLVGVVTLVITVGGGLVLTGYLDDADDGPPVSLDAEVNATEIRLGHDGGRTLAAADVEVILREDGSESRSRLSTWTFERDDGDDDFEPSERATTSHGFGPGTVEVVAVHRPTESVLLDAALTVGASS